MGTTDSGVLGQIANDPAIMMQLMGRALPGVTYTKPSLYGPGTTMNLRPGNILSTMGQVYGSVRDQRIGDELMADIARQQSDAEQPISPYGAKVRGQADYSGGQPQMQPGGPLERRPLGERVDQAMAPGPSMNAFLANMTPEKRRVFLQGLTTGGNSPIMAGWNTLQGQSKDARDRNRQSVLAEVQEVLARDPANQDAQAAMQKMLSEKGGMEYLDQRQKQASVEMFLRGIESQPWARKIQRTGNAQLDYDLGKVEYARGQKIQSANELLTTLEESRQYPKEILDTVRPLLISGHEELAKPWLAKGPDLIAKVKFREQFGETMAGVHATFKPYTPEQMQMFMDSPYWEAVAPAITQYQQAAYAKQTRDDALEEAKRRALEAEADRKIRLGLMLTQQEQLKLQKQQARDLKSEQLEQKKWSDQSNALTRAEKILAELRDTGNVLAQDGYLQKPTAPGERGVFRPEYQARITDAERRVKQLQDSMDNLEMARYLRNDDIGSASELNRNSYRSAISQALALPGGPLEKQQALVGISRKLQEDPLFVSGALPPEAQAKIQQDIMTAMKRLDRMVRGAVTPPAAPPPPEATAPTTLMAPPPRQPMESFGGRR